MIISSFQQFGMLATLIGKYCGENLMFLLLCAALPVHKIIRLHVVWWKNNNHSRDFFLDKYARLLLQILILYYIIYGQYLIVDRSSTAVHNLGSLGWIGIELETNIPEIIFILCVLCKPYSLMFYYLFCCLLISMNFYFLYQ